MSFTDAASFAPVGRTRTDARSRCPRAEPRRPLTPPLEAALTDASVAPLQAARDLCSSPWVHTCTLFDINTLNDIQCM